MGIDCRYTVLLHSTYLGTNVEGVNIREDITVKILIGDDMNII